MRVTREKFGLLMDGVSLCLDLKIVGQVRNELFASVFTKEKTSVENTNMLGQFVIKKEEMFGLLKTIEVGNSPGTEGL